MFNLIISAHNALYIDPGVMSALPQLIAAAVITIGAVAGVMWRKFKKKVKTNLKIDENAHKDVEAEVEFVEQPAEETAEKAEAEVSKES